MKAEILRKELEFSEDAKYYADKEYVTNSMLSLLNKSPQHLQMYFNGVKQETPALNFGKAFHTVVLEPQKVDNEIAIFDGRSFVALGATNTFDSTTTSGGGSSSGSSGSNSNSMISVVSQLFLNN